MSIVLRIRTACDRLERAANPMSLAELTGKSLKPAEKFLLRIEKDIDALAEAISEVLHAPQARALTMPERNRSAVAALTAWARECAAAILPPDSAHRMLIEHAQEEHREYWQGQSPHLVAGLISHTVGEALESQGVLAWRPEDGHIRLVDTQWLTAHADIFQHVFGGRPGGRRCRFCRIQEIPTSNQLQAVVPEQRKGGAMHDSIVQLPRGVVLTHEKCRPHWERWYSIARQYSTLEESQAADKAAGRESKAPPPMADLEQPKALPAGYISNPHHYTPSEQGA